MIDEDFSFLSDIEPIGMDSDISSSKASRIPLQMFLTTYVQVSRDGGNSIDVAKALGITPQGVRQRAGKLILKGVKLPKLGNTCRKQIANSARQTL